MYRFPPAFTVAALDRAFAVIFAAFLLIYSCIKNNRHIQNIIQKGIKNVVVPHSKTSRQKCVNYWTKQGKGFFFCHEETVVSNRFCMNKNILYRPAENASTRTITKSPTLQVE